MKTDLKIISYLFFSLVFMLSACSYNPFISNNHTTGNPAAALIGASVGVGTVALLGGPKSLMAVAGVGGGALGYYFSTLTHDAGGVVDAGGEVYSLGHFLGIYVPTDSLFETNTANLLPQSANVLDSVVTVLKRYPRNNILVSGNTSGFARARWERKLSLARAKKVVAYLWDAGVNNFKNPGIDTRQLNYVGYGNYFPIATDLNNQGIRENSRIQITSYPSNVDLHLDKRHLALHNIGSLNDDVGKEVPEEDCGKGDYKDECYED